MRFDARVRNLAVHPNEKTANDGQSKPEAVAICRGAVERIEDLCGDRRVDSGAVIFDP
jgi:hypothetical protein